MKTNFFIPSSKNVLIIFKVLKESRIWTCKSKLIVHKLPKLSRQQPSRYLNGKSIESALTLSSKRSQHIVNIILKTKCKIISSLEIIVAHPLILFWKFFIFSILYTITFWNQTTAFKRKFINKTLWLEKIEKKYSNLDWHHILSTFQTSIKFLIAITMCSGID
jgi:hypothetical protein